MLFEFQLCSGNDFSVIYRTGFIARVVPQKIQGEVPENYGFDIQNDMKINRMKFVVRSNKNKYIDSYIC